MDRRDSQVRLELIRKIADEILRLDLDHPTRVGIDGITASGKSTFAAELADELRKSGREIISTTLDGFHHPRERRHKYDYGAVIERLLAPLGDRADRRYRSAVFDLAADAPLDKRPESLKSKRER